MKSKLPVSIVIAIVLLALPLLFKQDVIHYLNLIFFFTALTAAWNIISGFGGQLSLGHSAFFAVGAYTSTLLYMDLGVTPWIGMIIGGLLAIPVAFLIGYPTFRLRGSYFVLATLALAEVVRRLLVYFKEVTRGSVGIPMPFTGSPKNLQFPNESGYYYLFIVLAFLTLYIGWRVRYGRIGYFLLAIREDEEAAESLGVSIRRCKLFAFYISAFFTAIIGTIYSQWASYIDPDAVCSIELSVQIALAGILGGMGTVWGPLAGAAILIVSQVLGLSFTGGLIGGVYMLYGLLLIVTILLRPQGVIGLFEQGIRGVFKLFLRRSTGSVTN
jgi:branched-chain amino acid transport system permease protein